MISVFLITAVPLYPQPRKRLQQHLQLVAVNRTRDRLGLRDQRGTAESPAEDQMDTTVSIIACFWEERHLISGAFQHWKYLCNLPTTPARRPQHLQPGGTEGTKNAFLFPEAAAGEVLFLWREENRAGSYTNLALSAPHREGSGCVKASFCKSESRSFCFLSPRNRFLTWPYLRAETTSVK